MGSVYMSLVSLGVNKAYIYKPSKQSVIELDKTYNLGDMNKGKIKEKINESKKVVQKWCYCLVTKKALKIHSALLRF